jgi:peroxiredoxin
VSVALLAARVALAGTFVVAGAAKLADLPGARAAALGMRVPQSLAGVGMPALAGFEVVIGLGLIPARSARYAAIAAAVTILALTALAGSAVARGLRPECHCFGRLGAGRIGGGTLIRNAAIFAVSAFAAVGEWEHPGAAPARGLGRLSTTTIAVSAALLLLAAVTARLARSNAGSRARRRAAIARPDASGATVEPADPATGLEPACPGLLNSDGMPPHQAALGVGSAAPDFLLDDVAGGTLSVTGIRSSGNRVLLTFVHVRCGECAMLMPSLAAWQLRHALGLTIAVVAAGERSATVAKAAQQGLERVGHDPERAVFAAYGVVRTPAAVLLDPDGTVASPVTYGTGGISSLVEGLSARSSRPQPTQPSGRALRVSIERRLSPWRRSNGRLHRLNRSSFARWTGERFACRSCSVRRASWYSSALSASSRGGSSRSSKSSTRSIARTRQNWSSSATATREKWV